jgi:hypothetical protein
LELILSHQQHLAALAWQAQQQDQHWQMHTIKEFSAVLHLLELLLSQQG